MTAYRSGDLEFASDVALATLTKVPEGVTFAVARGTVPPPGHVAPLFAVPFADDPARVALDVRGGNDVYRLELPGIGAFLVTRDAIRYALEPDVSPAAFEQALVDQVLPRACHYLGKPCLHASAATVEPLGAVAFTGDSGAGKSTLSAAFAARGRIVSDDSLALRATDDGMVALPGYASLRLWPDAADVVAGGAEHLERATPRSVKRRWPARLVEQPVPLVLVVVLAPEEASVTTSAKGEPRLEPLGARDAFLALQRQVHRLAPDDAEALAAEFALLTTLIARVPVARLRYRRDLTKLDALVDLVERHVRR